MDFADSEAVNCRFCFSYAEFAVLKRPAMTSLNLVRPLSGHFRDVEAKNLLQNTKMQ